MARGCSAARRMRGLFLALGIVSYGCEPELEPLDSTRTERGTLGEEVYKVLCRRMAGVELPDDPDGSESEALCLGHADTVRELLAAPGSRVPARLRALAESRAELVDAVDVLLPGELSDELELLMRELLPFYDPPEERVQGASRALAELLRQLAADSQALAGLESLARAGMTPFEGGFGSTRALWLADGLEPVLTHVLPALTEQASVRPAFDTLLSGLAFELSGPTDAQERQDRSGYQCSRGG